MKEIDLNEEKILNVLEPLRRKLSKEKKIFAIVIVSCSLILVVAEPVREVVFGSGGYFQIIPVFILVLIAGYFNGRISKARREYVYSYKKEIARRVLGACFEKAQYYPDSGFTEEQFKQSGLSNWYSRSEYKSEDLITGIYDNVKFEQSDVFLKHTTGSGKNKRTIIDVDGRLAKFQFEKSIVGKVVVAKSGSFLSLMQKGIRKVEMEDVGFNKMFDVYATDEHCAFYLLTPHRMEYIKKIYELDKRIYVAFDGRNLYILRSGKGGIFEPNESKKVDVSREIQKAYSEMQEIVQVIEVMKLDQ